MAAKKQPADNRHKQIDESTTDPFERAARVQTETSNDGRFSTYETAPKYRGAAKEG